MRRLLIIAGTATFLLLVGAGLVGGYVKRAVHQPQEFYIAALAVDQHSHEQQRRSFESRVSALYNDAQSEQDWRAAFTEKEINGWLATSLSQSFPDLLPAALSQPRIAIRGGIMLIGLQYRDDRLESPISVEVDLFAAESDILALRFCRARAGAVPVPVVRVVEHVSRVAKRLDWAVRWTRFEGDPVALVPLRGLVSNDAMRRELQTVELTDGEIILAGATIVHMASRAPGSSGSRLAR